jgi:hypothetical protein
VLIANQWWFRRLSVSIESLCARERSGRLDHMPGSWGCLPSTRLQYCSLYFFTLHASPPV